MNFDSFPGRRFSDIGSELRAEFRHVVGEERGLWLAREMET
jgi:hypothetical protein